MKNELIQKYTLNNEDFVKYYNDVLVFLKTGKLPKKENTIIIVGGQSGAGKSRLIPVARKHLKNNVVIIDFDELRSLHPYYNEVNEKYFELAHRILHADVEKVKNKILENLRQEKYDVIYEGALRNTEGFLDFARDFKKSGYNIKMYILAVPELESLGSNYLRYAMQLLLDENPRWVEKQAHDESYNGVIKTVSAFENEGLSDNIEVFIRGKNKPIKIYPKGKLEFKNVIEAILYGRESNRKKAIKDFSVKFETVTTILKSKNPQIISKLDKWVELYNKEKENI